MRIAVISYRPVPATVARAADWPFTRVSGGFFWLDPVGTLMRDEAEIREQYEFLTEQLESDEMRHDGVEKMFTYYKRALGWVLEEEHI